MVIAGERCERLTRPARSETLPSVTWNATRFGLFIGKKEKRVGSEDDQNLGDAHTLVAIERHSKLVLNIAIGKCDQATTDVFIEGLRDATGGEFQITADAFVPYETAIETTLGNRVDFAQLIEVYRAATGDEHRYSPPEVSNVEVVPVAGDPDPERIYTSLVERQNFGCSDGDPAIHPSDECVQPKVGEPLVRVLQLLSCSQIALLHTSDGSENCGSHLVRARELLEVAV